MTYNETLEYLYTRLPLYSRIGAAAYKADLYNTIQLCESLDNPQHKFKSIHIAGTNGKGSVSHMLATILQEAGYKTGLYTSPHLKDFRERIRIDGTMIPEEFVIDFTNGIITMIDKLNPSFFEITVAMAFDYFAKERVDIAIVEVGLGGRLDSTNVIIPELSIITNIGWDHMNILGNSLEKIAVEKAGIIKKNIPVVVGEFLPETKSVFEETAAERNSPIHFATDRFQALDWKWEKHLLIVEVSDKHNIDHLLYKLDLSGQYQTKNLLSVLYACALLKQKGWNITDQNLHVALQKVKRTTGLHGRWELIHQHPDIILDVAHNEAGLRQLTEQLEVLDYHQVHIVLGMVNDKDVIKALSALPRQAIYYFTNAAIPRALPAEELASKAALEGLKGTVYPNVNDALEQAKLDAQKTDLILVCGSIFLIAEVNGLGI